MGAFKKKYGSVCCLYMAYKLQQLDPKSNLICAPADHLILEETSFIKVSLEALDFTAKHNAFLTMGIKPLSSKYRIWLYSI